MQQCRLCSIQEMMPETSVIIGLIKIIMVVKNQDCYRMGSWQTFLVRSTYFRLNDGGMRFPFAKVIWKTKVPPKSRAFLWIVTNGTLLAQDNFMKKSQQGPKVLCVRGTGNPLIICFFDVHLTFTSGDVGAMPENVYPTIITNFHIILIFLEMYIF